MIHSWVGISFWVSTYQLRNTALKGVFTEKSAFDYITACVHLQLNVFIESILSYKTSLGIKEKMKERCFQSCDWYWISL